MKHKRKTKKGMTLIEVVISVSLLSILIIPLSGLVITTVKTNKLAENKQKAAYIGQKLLEEMKSYDNLKVMKNEDNFLEFRLLDGMAIKSDELDKVDTFEGEFQTEEFGSNFNVKLALSKGSEFNYDESNREKIVDNEFDIRIDFNKRNGFYWIKVGATEYQCTSNDYILTVDKENKMKIFIKGQINPIVSVSMDSPLKNKILIYLNENFDSDVFSINVENKTQENTDIYVKRAEISTGRLTVYSTIGNVKIYQNILDVKQEIPGDLYKIKVEVKKNGEELFTGESTNNIRIIK